GGRDRPRCYAERLVAARERWPRRMAPPARRFATRVARVCDTARDRSGPAHDEPSPTLSEAGRAPRLAEERDHYAPGREPLGAGDAGHGGLRVRGRPGDRGRLPSRGRPSALLPGRGIAKPSARNRLSGGGGGGRERPYYADHRQS